MNAALLKSPKEAELMNNNMFGKFRGFTLKPLPKENGTNTVGSNVAYVHPVTKTTIDDSTTVPSRSAPPPPIPKVPEIVRSQTQIKPVKPLVHRTNTTVSAPALPPLNPGSTARPIISSPILEGSTCTAKELMSPLKNSKYPVRTAPIVPSEISDYSGNSSPDVLSISSNKEKKSKEGTLHRIASFLKKEDKSSSQTLPRNPSINSKMNKIDKEKLKNIEISAPIQQSDASDSEYDAPGVSRTQSMRSPPGTSKRPVIQTFGSMRQPAGTKRPSSIVGSRPKSPPPPRPPAPPAITGMKIPGLPGYQNPPAPKKIDRNDYDDCEAVEAPLGHISEENSPNSPDNIYAVIEELPSPTKFKLKSPPTPSSNAAASKSASADSMGLLGEIVSEIENRNFDSIYSASTLKKKKGDPKNIITEPAYANTSEIDVDSESEYSNSNIKSNASTTSSGYLRPSAINTPIARVAPTKPENPKNTFSSFKTPTTNAPTVATYKPYSAALNRPGPYASSFKSNLDDKNSTKVDVRTRSPSPKGLPRQNSNPKSITAGAKKSTPDVVTSAIKTRPPDVVANGIKPKTPQKPQVVTSKIDSGLKIMTRQNSGDKLQDKPKKWQATRTKSQEASIKTTPKTTETVLNNKIGSNSKILTAAARPGPGKASNVASLQQKFETSANS